MPGIEHFLVFLAAGFLLVITPGPDMLYIATRSTTQGRMAGIVSCLGVGTGALIHIAAAAVGLSAIILYSTVAFQVVKWLGAGYLVYLGVKTLYEGRKKAEPRPDPLVHNSESLVAIYRKGILVNLLNPKVALFFMAFLPQFVDAASPYFTTNIILLGVLFDVMATVINIIVACFFAALGKRLMTHSAFHTIKTRFSGAIYILLGIGLAVSEK